MSSAIKKGKFKDLAKKRFRKEKMQQMDREIELEAEAMDSLQMNAKESLDLYMEDKGFNEIIRRLGSTPFKKK